MSPSPSAPTLPARYCSFEQVGRGGFGEVLRAWDSQLERPVAIKRLLGQDPEVRARFLREARRTADLRHPHVIEVLDLGEGPDGAPYVVYEWVDGRDLQKLVDSGELPDPGVLPSWGAAIARALHVAHEAGVVHRDVKPANVLLRKDGHVLLTDLGIARVDGGQTVQTAEGLLLGTPGFMAPELWRGEAASPASDQWAWAATLQVLAGGPPPWGSDQVPEILARLRDSPRFPAAAPGLTPTMREVLTRALSPEPGDRLPDLRAFAEALEDVSSTPPRPDGTAAPTVRMAAPREAPRPGPSPSSSRRPHLVGLAALGALALAWAWRAASAPPSPPPAAPASPRPPEPDATSTALEAAASRALALHLQGEENFRAYDDHIEEVRRHLSEDPRAPLVFKRWMVALRRWLAARPSPWAVATPSGSSRKLYWQVHARVTRPLKHVLLELQALRRRQDRVATSLESFSGEVDYSPQADEADREILRILEEEFWIHLGPRDAGVARLELEAYLCAATMANNYRKGETPPGAQTRRAEILEQILAALDEPYGPVAKRQLATAVTSVMLDYRAQEVVAPATWDRLQAHLADTLEAPLPRLQKVREGDARARLALACAVVQALVVGSRVLHRPAPPEVWATTERALAWLERAPAVPPAVRRAKVRELLLWIERRNRHVGDADEEDGRQVAARLGRLL